MQVLTVDYNDPNAAKNLLKSFRETGFAVIENHPIHWDKIEKAFAEWAEFFNDPRRHDYILDKEKQDGYIPFEISETAKGSEHKDIKEFYHMYYPWGRYPDFMSNNSRELFDETIALGRTLLSWLQAELPEEVKSKFNCPLQDMVSIDRTLQRFLYYPAMKGNENPNAIRAAAHEDINLITLLPAATQPGLQAMDLEGNWHTVPINPGTMVLNAGDMLQELTNQYIVSTTHRVINPAGDKAKEARMTIPTFIHPKADVWLSDKYPTADGYLKERLGELGLM